jgi:hypothetical protein
MPNKCTHDGRLAGPVIPKLARENDVLRASSIRGSMFRVYNLI